MGDPLARPLDLPKIVRGEKYPTGSGRIVDQAYGYAFGPGAVYAAALGKDATLQFAPPRRFE